MYKTVFAPNLTIQTENFKEGSRTSLLETRPSHLQEEVHFRAPLLSGKFLFTRNKTLPPWSFCLYAEHHLLLPKVASKRQNTLAPPRAPAPWMAAPTRGPSGSVSDAGARGGCPRLAPLLPSWWPPRLLASALTVSPCPRHCWGDGGKRPGVKPSLSEGQAGLLQGCQLPEQPSRLEVILL